MEASESSAGSGEEPMVSIVVPAFNEAARIGGSIQKISAFMRRSPLSYELIVVDDGSADETAEIVKQAQVQELRLVRGSPEFLLR